MPCSTCRYWMAPKERFSQGQGGKHPCSMLTDEVIKITDSGACSPRGGKTDEASIHVDWKGQRGSSVKVGLWTTENFTCSLYRERKKDPHYVVLGLPKTSLERIISGGSIIDDADT